VRGLPHIWVRLGGDDIEPPSPEAIPLSSSVLGWSHNDSSGDLLDSIHEFHTPNHRGDQLLAVEPTPVFRPSVGFTLFPVSHCGRGLSIRRSTYSCRKFSRFRQNIEKVVSALAGAYQSGSLSFGSNAGRSDEV
jgi:hypothetical protein